VSISPVNWSDVYAEHGQAMRAAGLILYRPTHSRRENFTLMHELGHHLVAQDIDCLSWLADQPEPARVLEQLCDQIAADLLIHPDHVAAALDGGPPDAEVVVALFDTTEASRSACAIALARRLPCDGFIVLIEDGADQVFFAARARDTRPCAWRGDTIPVGHPLRQTPSPPRALVWWPYPTGSERREYFMSCTSAKEWRIAVFAENNLFGVPGFHIPQEVPHPRQPPHRPSRHHRRRRLRARRATFVLTDALDPLFPLAGATGLWAIATGIGLLRLPTTAPAA
jgi:hypothetical protein